MLAQQGREHEERGRLQCGGVLGMPWCSRFAVSAVSASLGVALSPCFHLKHDVYVLAVYGVRGWERDVLPSALPIETFWHVVYS